MDTLGIWISIEFDFIQIGAHFEHSSRWLRFRNAENNVKIWKN